MTVAELAEKHGRIEKFFHDGSVTASIYNFQCYLERTSFGYILKINVNDGITNLFNTFEELEQALIGLKHR
jgi:hypothetical protein